MQIDIFLIFWGVSESIFENGLSDILPKIITPFVQPTNHAKIQL